MTESLNAELTANLKPNDQWKSGGICQMCRRRKYCKKRCTAHREFINGKALDYFRRMTHVPEIQNAMRNAGGENHGED